MCASGVVLAQGRRPGGESLPWLVLGEHALPLRYWAGASPLGLVASVTDLVENWSRHESTLHALITSARTRDVIGTEGISTHSLALEAPIRPRQVFCTIGNYERQIVEAAVDADDGPDGPRAADRRRAALDGVRRRRETGDPYVCLTSSARVAAPIGTLQLPHDSLDWEVEIAAVVRSQVPHVGSVEARNVIAGYCTANDLTIRTRVVRDDVPAVGSDWIQSKGAPGTLPLGPWFVPVWQIPDVAALRLRLWVNGQLMQDDLASDMVFGIERQVSYLSSHTQLHAGDVICTGSPAGFGAHHGRFLRGGDELIAEVSGLGRQRLTCVDAGSAALAVQGEPTSARTGIR
jgi:2,4-diketo-3-deoxy-L-fuconate hydrolase